MVVICSFIFPVGAKRLASIGIQYLVAVSDGPPEHKMSSELKNINANIIIEYLESVVRWVTSKEPNYDTQSNCTPFDESINPTGKPKRIICECEICIMHAFRVVFAYLSNSFVLFADLTNATQTLLYLVEFADGGKKFVAAEEVKSQKDSKELRDLIIHYLEDNLKFD